MAQRILVTGASGFLGRHFCAYLEAQSIEVHTLGRTPVAGLPNHVAAPEDVSAISRALSAVKPDGVLHLAGSGTGGFLECLLVNAVYAGSLLDAMSVSRLDDRPLLLISSASEIGLLGPQDVPAREDVATRPASAYGASKLAQTQLGLAAARAGRPISIVRLSNLLGPGLPASLGPARFATQLAAIKRSGSDDGTVFTGPLDMIRDYIDVNDVCRLAWSLFMNRSARGRLVNLCSGMGVRTADLLDGLIRISGLRIEVKTDDSVPAGVPIHVGSTALLEELTGPLELMPIEESLAMLWSATLGSQSV